MKNYAKYIKQYWYSFLLGPLFMIMEACGEFILPYISANIINEGVAKRDIDYIIQNGIYIYDGHRYFGCQLRNSWFL